MSRRSNLKFVGGNGNTVEEIAKALIASEAAIGHVRLTNDCLAQMMRMGLRAGFDAKTDIAIIEENGEFSRMDLERISVLQVK